VLLNILSNEQQNEFEKKFFEKLKNSGAKNNKTEG